MQNNSFYNNLDKGIMAQSRDDSIVWWMFSGLVCYWSLVVEKMKPLFKASPHVRQVLFCWVTSPILELSFCKKNILLRCKWLSRGCHKLCGVSVVSWCGLVGYIWRRVNLESIVQLYTNVTSTRKRKNDFPDKILPVGALNICNYNQLWSSIITSKSWKWNYRLI